VDILLFYNNSFPLHPKKSTTLNRNQLQNPPTDKHRWVTLPYVGKETTSTGDHHYRRRDTNPTST